MDIPPTIIKALEVVFEESLRPFETGVVPAASPVASVPKEKASRPNPSLVTKGKAKVTVAPSKKKSVPHAKPNGMS